MDYASEKYYRSVGVGMYKDSRPDINYLKLIGFFVWNTLILVFPGILAFSTSWIASLVTSGGNCQLIFQNYILDQFTYLVLCPSLIVLVTCLFYADRIKERLGQRWSAFSKVIRLVCGITSSVLLVLTFLIALNVWRSFLIGCSTYFFIIECVGACCCVILQCLTHSEAYIVQGVGD